MTRHVTRMTIDDAEHYTAEQRAAIMASYPAHEREARVKGVPQLGSGRVFPLGEEDVTCKPFAIPNYWPLIGAFDFGWDHPTAAVRLAWDRDADCVYVTNAYRKKEATPIIHAAAVKPWGAELPWAWPHDGNNETAAGEALAKQYREQGLKMLPESARYADERVNRVEPGLMDMLDRMLTGRFKVFANLEEWFDEFRLYHRKDGLVVKQMDDLMSATRYGVMSLRFAKVDARMEWSEPVTVSSESYDPHSW